MKTDSKNIARLLATVIWAGSEYEEARQAAESACQLKAGARRLATLTDRKDNQNLYRLAVRV